MDAIFNQYLRTSKVIPSVDPAVLAMNHVYFAFLLLLTMLSLAAFTFITELVFKKTELFIPRNSLSK